MSYTPKRRLSFGGGSGAATGGPASRSKRARYLATAYVMRRRYTPRGVSAAKARAYARAAALDAAELRIKTHQINEDTYNSLTAPHYAVVTDDAMKLQQGDGKSNMSGHHVKGIGLQTTFYLKNNAEPVFGKLYFLYSRTGATPGVGAGQFNLTEHNTGDTALSNNVMDLAARMNKDYFTVLSERDFQLGATTGDPAGATPAKILKFYHSFKGRDFVYPGTNTLPSNGRYFFVLMCRRTDNDGTGSTAVEVSMDQHFLFKDP